MQSRAAASRAKDELNGIILHDNELKLGWGKAIVIPSAPLYTAIGPPAAVKREPNTQLLMLACRGFESPSLACHFLRQTFKSSVRNAHLSCNAAVSSGRSAVLLLAGESKSLL